MMSDITDHTDDTHLEPDQVTGELKPVNETVRPDPQPDIPMVEATGTIPAHEPDAIRGVIQHKDDPSGAIKEKLPDEQDLAEGKITPAAVEEIRYDDSPRAFDDNDLEEMVTLARNKTSLARLNHAETVAVFKTLEAEGYVVSKL